MRPATMIRSTRAALAFLLSGMVVCGAWAAESLPSRATQEPSQEAVPAPSPVPDVASGKATHAWLSAQEAGKQASRHKQTLSGPAMRRIHDAYLNSFNGGSATNGSSPNTQQSPTR